MARRDLVLVVVILALLATAGVLFVLVRQRPQPEEAEADTSRAQPAPVGGAVSDIGSGASVDGGWYQLYFTAPKYPDNPANHRGGIDERLVQLMDRAQRTLDVADYDFDLVNVADAMVRAKQRGVTVRMVTDGDTVGNTRQQAIQDAFGKLKRASIPVVDDGKRQAIMHNKFTVVDGEWVQTGSWNYTDGDTYRLNNHAIVIRSRELAANYTAEFNKMFEKKQFGASKDRAVPNPTVTINGTRVETCFAAEGKCADRIVATLNGASRGIQFLAFSFTSDKIAAPMLAKAKAGLPVSGVFETTGSNTSFSEYGKMKQQKLDVYQDGNPWVMHHKVIIVDERIVIFGSFNFSDNADKDNDENLLIVDNPEMARAFKAEFDRVLALAKNPPAKK